MLLVVVISVDIINLQYGNRTEKTVAAKSQAKAKGTSVREVERQLGADTYLWQQQLWAHSNLHWEFLLQQIFQHAMAMGQKEYDHAICWGQREPSPERNLSAELTTMKLVCPNSQHQDFDNLYWEVYQLHRLPSKADVKKQQRSSFAKRSWSQ